MSLTININTSASAAAFNLRNIGAAHQRNLTRLSTGLRINSSVDDVAGVAMSLKLSTQIRRENAYAANLNNSLSFLKTQDSALKQLGHLLERMSELKALAHDVTKNGKDVELYQAEYMQLQTQFAQTTTEKFNGINLFSQTSASDLLYLPPPDQGDTIQISRPSLGNLNTGDTLKVGTGQAGDSQYELISGSFTWTEAKADAEARGGYLASITSQAELDKINTLLPGWDGNTWLGGTDAGSEGQWRWVSGEAWNFTNWGPAQPNNGGGGDSEQNYLWAISGTWDDFDNIAVPQGYLMEKGGNHQYSILSLPWSDLISSIQQVANARAQNGAEQKRLDTEADLNASNIENREKALNRIQDVDIAEATTKLCKTKVLMEGGTALLAQANVTTQSILRLMMQNSNQRL